ncbi:MAG: hypothetical protein JO111_18380 [Caulobacteraceae bacterium]|nr:hypothetical protein [Caulobacteraceae bacterium]
MQSDMSYNHQTIMLDGETFSHCRFAACRLIYSGGGLPQFDGCHFDACEWKFEEAAARTLSHLKLMWGVGAKPAVQATIKEITVAAR